MHTILSHFEESELMNRDKNIEILCISETWLYPEISSSFISIPNFRVYRCDAGRGSVESAYV